MKKEILNKVDILHKMWQVGSLGGEIMPEDENPHLEKSSSENYLYFTLPMALNYQRNSYKLWESANKTYNDEETRFVFNPKEVLNSSFEKVQSALIKYHVALQKNKQTEIWITLCKTFVELFDGDIRKLFDKFNNDITEIKTFIQKEHKKLFPYLCGTKICNYWLYVIWQYTDREYVNLDKLTVAPDTHVVKATHKLGLINDEEFNSNNVQEIVIDKWNELFEGTKYKPIDIHTALWLWSRNGFKELNIENCLEQVLSTSYYVYDGSKHVKINLDKIKDVVNNYNFSKPKHWLAINPFGLLDMSIEDIVNYLILLGSINCCFWGNPKWAIEVEGKDIDGSFALIYTLLKIKKEKGHLNFELISFDEYKKYFKGNIDIPLLEERYNILYEVSKTINNKMNGNFYNYIKHINDDIKLMNIIVNNFPSFIDKRIYNGKNIYFYKLAQLVTSDILHIRELLENIDVDYSHLVGCADYKIPQVLRNIGILEFDEELSNLVNNKIELKENSIYEIEIRANMIVAIDLLKKELNNKLCAIDINDIIWSLGQDKSINKYPYHLTRTTSY